MLIAYQECVDYIADIFKAAGVDEKSALMQAELFVNTEAKGVWSHGIGLVSKYTQRFKDKTVNLNPDIKIEDTGSSTAKVDGDQGLGVVVMDKAVEVAIKKARDTGISCLTATNLQHYAAGLYYATRPVLEGMIMTLTANSPASIAPFGGRKKYFGTNPYTFAAPMGKKPFYCLDMASSVVAGNKLESYEKAGVKVPVGMGLDRDGKPCEDPGEILHHGTLLPFGGAKGSGIAGMVNILSGILSGAAYEDDVISLCRDLSKPTNYGCCIQLINIAHFMDLKTYSERAEKWADAILNNPPAKDFQSVVYPGYLEDKRFKKSLKDGIEMNNSSLKSLRDACDIVSMQCRY